MMDALLLIQDVQLLCFTVIFGFLWFQHRNDLTRRWLFYSFLANAVGSVLDFASPYLPAWLGREGLSLAMIPLSYAFVNVAIVYFVRRYRETFWVSAAIVLGTLPFFLLWSGHAVVYAEAYRSSALQDFAIALQSIVTGFVLLGIQEESTRPPRVLLSLFFYLFAVVEFARAFVGLVLHQNPDVYSHPLEVTSSVAYVVATSILPLAFVWMINTRLESDLVRQNMLDPLTQALNRRGLRHALDYEVALHGHSPSDLTVAILDLDRFKKLNDTYGHAAGDAVLIGVATLLRSLLREIDTVARLGGEEFVLLLPQTNAAEAMALLERLRIAIEEYSETFAGQTIYVTASFGASTTRTGHETSASELLREADLALYGAKEDGRNRVNFFRTGENHGHRLPQHQRQE